MHAPRLCEKRFFGLALGMLSRRPRGWHGAALPAALLGLFATRWPSAVLPLARPQAPGRSGGRRTCQSGKRGRRLGGHSRSSGRPPVFPRVLLGARRIGVPLTVARPQWGMREKNNGVLPWYSVEEKNVITCRGVEERHVWSSRPSLLTPPQSSLKRELSSCAESFGVLFSCPGLGLVCW